MRTQHLLVVALLLALFGPAPRGSAQVRRATASRKPVVRVIQPSKPTDVLSAPKTVISGRHVEIDATLDLGEPIVSRSRVEVSGASSNTEFSSISWPKLQTDRLSGGVTLVSAREVDRESIPGITLTLAVPASATGFTLTLVDPQWKQFSGQFLPTPVREHDSMQYRYTASYGLAKTSAEWSKPRTFRSLRTVTVWQPLVMGTGSARKVLTKAALKIGFTFDGSVAASSASTDPVFAGMNRSLVINPNDVSSFAVTLRPRVAVHAKRMGVLAEPPYYAILDTDSYRWIDPNATYIKLTVTRDALYRVTAADIARRASNFDLNAAGWTASNVRLYHNGRQVPIAVDSDATGHINAIVFYGERVRGVGLEYYNDYTDSSGYFLTIAGNGTPKRYRPRIVIGSPSDVSSAEIALHHERDLFKYDGDKGGYEVESLQRTETVPGERFYWYAFHGPAINQNNQTDTSRLLDTFYVAGLPSDVAGKTARFHFFFRGMSKDPAYPNDPTHHVKIRLNGQDIAEEFFKEYDSIAVEPEIPLSQLHVGANVIEMISVGTRATNDFFYVDYYEVRYEGALAPSTDTAVARGQYDFTTVNADPIRRLTGPSQAVTLFNLNDTTVLPYPFIDSSTPSARYVGADQAAMRAVDAMVKITDWSILDTRSAADYLIITHPLFRHAADLLKVRRTTAGLRSLVVDVENVYNAFGYGSNDPEALRRFLSYAYYKYTGAPPALVTLLGDGSWDPKMNLSNEYFAPSDKSNQQSFIPTWGDPVSDFYFTLVDDGRLDTLPSRMMIARIPVSSSEEADAYVRKLVDYESQAPAEWNHNLLFVAGGDAGSQHDEFVQEAKIYSDPPPNGIGLSVPPTNVRSQIIERTDFEHQLDVTHVGDIQNAVRDGRSILYFAGHGATFTTDMLLGDPKLWRNKSLYPVLITLSCRTGAFAEPNQISLNENFLRTEDAGVIMALGTSGFGEVQYDDWLSARLFSLMRSYRQTHDTSQATMMNLTELFTMSKIYASDSIGGYGFVDLNSVLQYSVLGDAALGFALRPQPEFVEREGDMRTTTRDGRPTTTVHLSDTTMNVSAVVHNVGFSAEQPVVVRIRDAGPKGLPFDIFDTLPRLDTTATVTASFGLTAQSVGEHTITVTIDPSNAYPETHEEDNEASTRVLVTGLSVTPFYPYEGAFGLCDITTSAARVLLITPRSDAQSHAGTIEIELDTTSAFTHPWHHDTAFSGDNYAYADLPLTSVPVPASGVYWWRSRLRSTNGDVTDWQAASFSHDATTEQGLAYTSPDQLRPTIVSGLDLNASGRLYIPERDSIIYDLIAVSLTDSVLAGTRSSITINRRPTYLVSQFTTGWVLATLTPDGAALDTVYEFARGDDSTYQATTAKTFDSLVAAIPTGRRVIVMTYAQPFMLYFNYSPDVQAAFASLGSAQDVRQIGYFQSYAMLGMKGSAPGSAKEKLTLNGAGPAEVYDTIVTVGTSGVAEMPSTAAAVRYRTLSWEGPALPVGTDIEFTLRGTTRDGREQTAATYLASSGRSFDLSGIDAGTYERISVVARLVRGSSSDTSPELSGIRLSYDPAPELVFTDDSVTVAPTAVPEGVPVVASYHVRALTCTAADNIPVSLVLDNKGSRDTLSHTIAHLDGYATTALADTLQTAGNQGETALTATINPQHRVNEQLIYNDQLTGSFLVNRDTTKPLSDILIDDRHLPAYGYASSDPWITVNLVTKSAIRQTDSLSITARFLREDSASNFTIISAANPGDFRVVFEPAASGSTQASLRFQPLHPLSPGRYQIAAYSHDASGNVADTVVQTFTVSAENGLEHVMNYPNPFKGETDFTFVLRNDARADLKIVVYTVAGRKIRTLVPNALHAGINIVHWDGRDEEGNVLANGTYLYRVVLSSSDASGKDVTQGVTEKAVLAR